MWRRVLGFWTWSSGLQSSIWVLCPSQIPTPAVKVFKEQFHGCQWIQCNFNQKFEVIYLFFLQKSTSEDRRTGSVIKNTCHPYREPRFNFQHLHEATHKHWKFQLQRVQGPLLAASSTCTQTKIKTEKQNETPKEFHLLILKCLPNYKNTWALKWFCKRTKLEERADSAVVDYGCGNLERHTCM